MSRIIEALNREHKSISGVLDILDSEIAYLAEYKGRRRADYRLVWSAIDYFTDFPDMVHHPKEDLVYEQLHRVDPTAARNVGDIPAAHVALAQELRALAAELKAVMEDGTRSRAALTALARSYVQHMRRHLEGEEALFFPVSERTLDARTWAELEQRMVARLDPLIGGESGERFEALRRNIANAATEQHPPPRE